MLRGYNGRCTIRRMDSQQSLTETKRAGRPPVEYSAAFKEQALILAEQGLPAEKICAELQIGLRMLNSWRDDPIFDKRFRIARDSGLELYADRLMTIAADEPDVMRARLHSENWRWLLSRRLRGQYGDSIDVNVTERVEVGSILSEARARLRPMRDSAAIEDAVIVENQLVSTHPQTDNESVSGLDDLLA